MARLSSPVLFAAASALLLGLSSCSSSSSSSSGGTVDLQNPKVSFKTDVVAGVFNASCGFSTCHGSQTNPQGGLFLGAQSAKGSDSSTVHQKLVGVASGELATMNYVAAGDLAGSYLLHKMDGDQGQFDAKCAGGTCQSSMPQGSDILPADKRDVVRRWIAQGAQDN